MAPSYPYLLSLFIFRRELRIQDNTGFLAACKKSKAVIPCFIFDPRQVKNQNTYKSNNAVQFMIESLKELHTSLKKQGGKLYIFEGIAEKVVANLLKKESIDAVFCNRDYTPFSLNRDNAIFKSCLKYNATFEQYDDILLHSPDKIRTKNNDPYQVFTPFWRYCSRLSIAKIDRTRTTKNVYSGTIKNARPLATLSTYMPSVNNNINTHGGRSHGLTLLKKIKNFKKYESTRNIPSIATTHLSAALKFGTVSIREAYYAIKKNLGSSHPLLRQLFWRDFYTHVAYHSPYVFGQSYRKKYDKIKWSKSKKKFEAWCEGLTGFPIIDAGMRQLNTTGFMHNRVRMLTASFLIKDLHIDWRWGEKYFAQKLVDYDPSVNNGNWQWVASTGCDAAPYFRIFNPWIQQKKFDAECIYIKTWVKELEDLSPKEIHTWEKTYKTTDIDYPKPIVNHKTEAEKTKQIYYNLGNPEYS